MRPPSGAEGRHYVVNHIMPEKAAPGTSSIARGGVVEVSGLRGRRTRPRRHRGSGAARGQIHGWGRGKRPEPFALGELTIHYAERQVTVAGRQVELTATEYELLRLLSLNAGRVVANDALVRQVWSGRKTGDVNLVRNFVKKLRKKLGDDAQNPAWIFSVRGVGYRMPNPRDA